MTPLVLGRDSRLYAPGPGDTGGERIELGRAPALPITPPGKCFGETGLYSPGPTKFNFKNNIPDMTIVKSDLS